MHAVLVHSGDNHGGHYVVFINPAGDGKVCVVFILYIYIYKYENIDIIFKIIYKFLFLIYRLCVLFLLKIILYIFQFNFVLK